MQLKWSVPVVLGLFARAVLGTQLWHQVNRYDADGNECRLRGISGMACSQLCVQSLGSCPQPLRPECPLSQKFCADGNCHDECTAEIQANNPCHCLRSGKDLPGQATGLIPCLGSPKVTIQEFHPWNSKVDIREACGNAVGISNQSSSVAVWGSGWVGGVVEAVWAECPPAPAPSYKFNESYWLATFAVNGALALMIAVWAMYKVWAERLVRSTKYKLSSSIMNGEKKLAPFLKKPATIAENVSIVAGQMSSFASTADSEIQLYGYCSSIYGTACLWGIAAVTVLWICFLGVWTADYYGALPGARRGVAYSLALESSFLELQSFLVLWGICFMILIALYVLKPQLRNYFRVQTLPVQGQFVCTERAVSEIKMLSDHASWVQRKINRATKALVVALSRDREYTTCRVQSTTQGRQFFTYQCTRYVYDLELQQFVPFEFDLGTSHCELLAQINGLSVDEAAFRLELVGPNFIEVCVPGLFASFAREFVSFFYIYQFIFLWAFYFYAYYQVGLVNTGVILLSAGIKVGLRMQSERRLKRMAEQAEDVAVLRNGSWVRMSTTDLVPGDVIKMAAGAHMSCDCILLSGSAVMDESSLTGEPLPVRKFALQAGDGHYDSVSGKASTVFAGTTTAQVQGERVLALVWRTGTASDKGQLVRQILFPSPMSFIFNEQMRIVVAILIVYAIFVMAMATYLYQGNSVAIAFFGVFAIAQLLSPLLPAAMVIGQSVAAARLRRKHIYCIDPQRIMVAGKVQIIAFDKTGTMTREFLNFYGVRTARAATFDSFNGDLPSVDVLFQMGVASCHAVTDLNGQLIGNPVDIEQFKASGWSLDQQPKYLDKIVPPANSLLSTLHVVRRFEFVHTRASMSVVAQDEGTGQIHIFVKGSFERIKQISSVATVPADYDLACSQLAREGCYVLSIAHRIFGGTMDELRNMSQEDIESGCDFIGLLVFKNMLKPDSEQAISDLKGGSTRTIMITGDTALTGIYIARQSGMIPPNSRVILGESASPAGPVHWTDVDTQQPIDDLPAALCAIGSDGFPSAELAVGGSAFQHLSATRNIDALLLNIRVFARMRPVDKVDCVQLHMRRAITAMCGDGGNDCGALRAAHVGLALSDAEASIVSPFSTSQRSIMSCVELLRESRAGLATSFANFAALICYGQVMSGMIKMASFYFSISLTENLWMLIDGAISTALALTVSMSGPAKRLAAYRPTARILGPQMLAAVGGTVLINWIFSALSYVWLFSQPWFRCNEHATAEIDLTKWWLLGDNYESSILSFVSTFQFINNGFIVNYGYLHRAAWYRNYALLTVWGFLMAFVSYMLLADPNRVGCAFRLNCGTSSVLESIGYTTPTWQIEDYNNALGHNVIPLASRYKLWVYCLGNMAVTSLWQLAVVNGPVRKWLRRNRPLRRLKVKL
ncbi:hypothetical protein BX661DRAFT_186205 [Kickxella alabastrina]|uniref:uncharacterized protein n=1 Tax=Kickxella alabastrina TaxID=61397 RepID=UPI00221E85A0|nr:uncharacterized protein BX661DRAFT_186205 [Kickxella alabastrina]KAI7823668.1 hypothetical protein BX661DRAFT_186205 [Kickxella alabastrina]